MTVVATGVGEVKGLVYVAGMAPDEGETVEEPCPQNFLLIPTVTSGCLRKDLRIPLLRERQRTRSRC